MDIATLQKFCSTSEVHEQYGITQPFSIGVWTYATNGHICIRVPRIPEVENKVKASIGESAEKLFWDAKNRISIWQELPEFELKYSPCPDCGGNGYLVMCPNFNHPDDCGDGTGKLCKEHNEECARGCKPEIKGAFKCEECEGKGKIKLQGKYIVKGAAGTTQISAIYLDMIKDLPNVLIAPYDETSALLIQFDGGEGVLMPMKQV
jgi:hypothetical protein